MNYITMFRKNPNLEKRKRKNGKTHHSGKKKEENETFANTKARKIHKILKTKNICYFLRKFDTVVTHLRGSKWHS